jgi:hypothetical protein
MVFDILRFNHFALDLLRDKDNSEGLTVREYVLREGYSPAFRDFYLVVSAVQPGETQDLHNSTSLWRLRYGRYRSTLY